METGAVWPLELRQVGNVLTGTFPYGKLAVIASTGRVRKERFEARAFAFAVASAVREVHLLVGHDYNKPLARKLNGSLILNDSDEALEFRATLPPEADRPTYMTDALAQQRAGLIGGLSPGFQVPPESTVPGAQRFIPEPGNAGVAIRSISSAVLAEFSLVTRPIYSETMVDLRSQAELDAEALERGAWLWL